MIALPTVAAGAERLLEALLRSSLQGALGIAVVWIVCRLFPRLPAAVRCGLWWAACLKLVAGLFWIAPVRLPLLPAVEFTANVPHSPGPSRLVEERESRAQTKEVFISPLPREGEVRWAIPALLWFAGLLLVTARSARQLRHTRWVVHRAQPLEEAWIRAVFFRLCARLSLRRAPELLASADVKTPQAMGLLRTRIVLPQSGLARLSPPEVAMTLCHELLHLRRRDLWLGWIPALAQRIFFFHPLAALAAREYAIAREAACDAEVLRVLGTAPQAYGRLLLRWGVAPRETGLAAAGASPSLKNLKRRLQMLQQNSEPRRRPSGWWWLAGAAALAGVIPLQLVSQEPAPEAEPAVEAVVAPEALPAEAPAGVPVTPEPPTLPAPTVAPLPARPEVRPLPGGRPAPPPASIVDGVAGGIPGGIPGGVRGGIPDGVAEGVPGALAPPAIAPPAGVPAPTPRPALAPSARISPAPGTPRVAPLPGPAAATPSLPPSPAPVTRATPVAVPSATPGHAAPQPPPTAAPSPARPAKSSGFSYHLGKDEAWVLYHGEGPRIYSSAMTGSNQDIAEAKRLRASYGEEILYFRSDGKRYVVRDAAVLRKAHEIFKPQGELGAKQGELGAQQGELGAKQGQLGAKQGALGAEIAALAAERIGNDEADGESREVRQEEIARQMEELGRRQEELGRRQQELGRKQGKLGRLQEEAARKAAAAMRELMDQAIRSGAAQEVK